MVPHIADLPLYPTGLLTKACRYSRIWRGHHGGFLKNAASRNPKLYHHHHLPKSAPEQKDYPCAQ
eukprot:4088819-Amphidinium_carterae.1